MAKKKEITASPHGSLTEDAVKLIRKAIEDATAEFKGRYDSRVMALEHTTSKAAASSRAADKAEVVYWLDDEGYEVSCEELTDKSTTSKNTIAKKVHTNEKKTGKPQTLSPIGEW